MHAPRHTGAGQDYSKELQFQKLNALKDVIEVKVHRDGSLTDLQIMQPSSIDAFTKSSFNAIKLSNPTVPLPLEFPDENAPFIVTFYFNETPPGGGS